MTTTPVGRPIPIPRAILWKPAASAEARMPGYPVFIEQTALQALQEHHGAHPKEGVLGFLVGDLCRDPETRVSYVVIDATIRLNQAVYGDKTGVVVGKLWDRIQVQLKEIGGQLIGWYHSHPPDGPVPAAGDQETHLMYFTQPWQIAVVLAREGAQPVGGVFRPTRDPASVRTSLPFYELVDEAAEPGAKVSVLEWANFRTETGVLRGPTAPPAAAEESRTTLQIVRPKIPKPFTPRRPAAPQAKPPSQPEPPATPAPPSASPPPPPPKTERRPYTPSVRRSQADDELNPGLLDLLGPAKSPPAPPKPPPSDDGLEIERASDPSSAGAPPPPPPPPPPEVKKPEPKRPEPKKPEPKKPEPRPQRPTMRPKAIEDLPLLVDMDEVAQEETTPELAEPPAPAEPPARPAGSGPPPSALVRHELDAAFEEVPELPPEPERPQFEAPVIESEPLWPVGAEEPSVRRGRRWPIVVAVIVLLGTVGAAIAVKGFLLRDRGTAPAPRASQPEPRVDSPVATRRPPPPPPRPAERVIAPARTGFIAGAGQRGRVRSRLPEPLVFEVRDTANRPVAGQAVTFRAANATLDPARGATDAGGQLRTEVTLGPRAQTVTITATVGSIERTATVTAVLGPAATIAMTCGAEPVGGRLTIALGAPAVLRLRVEDVGGNVLAVTGLRVDVGDERVLRVAATAASGTTGSVTLHPGREGTTSLAVVASGLRETISAAVARRGSRCD